MKKLPTLHKEHFEAWLMSQPDDVGWLYTDCKRCIGATFVLDIYKVDTAWGGFHWELTTFTGEAPIPDWLLRVIGMAHEVACGVSHQNGLTYITAPILRECWRKLNPEPVTDEISQRCVAMGLTKTK